MFRMRQRSDVPLTRDVVLIGGGHAHALVLRRWGMRPLPGARLTVINPDPSAPYTGMLPGHVAGHYSRDALEIDLVRLARFAGARVILGRAEGIDRATRRVRVTGRGDIAYDIASIDIGITSDLPELPGFAAHAVGAKPLGPYAVRWQAFLAAVRAGQQAPEVAVIGGGVGGVELAMAMAHALRAANVVPAVSLVDRGRVLDTLRPGTRAALLERMAGLGIRVVEMAGVRQITEETVVLSDGQTLPGRFVVGAAGARPQDWLAETGLALSDGFIAVDETLRSVTDPAIYAVGDCAHLSHAPRPKAGVYAVREAPVLYHNIRADLTGRQRRRYAPQRDYLKLISLGGTSALADKAGLRLAGELLWHWKDRIDRAFMRKFHDLAPMAPAPLPRVVADGVREAVAGGRPMCGGCGAKIGSAALGRVLHTLPPVGRKDVDTGPGDDAAILKFGRTRQVISTDHLRAFSEDPWLMGRIAAIHALGDVWAMGASPQAALASIVLPRMSEALAERTLAEIMAGAADVFTAEGAEIVGGHSTLGAEMTVGFTVTGIAPGAPITLAGGQAGDILILTKPIGTGTILAGEMAMQAQGRWVEGALISMQRPQGSAARALATAHAMTDVTGFGLAGHLLAICTASGHGAEIRLDSVPVLDGAVALAARGVRSTLHPANMAASRPRMTLPDGPRAELLFDPQTAGGLLAAVPAARAPAALAALRKTGFAPAEIGTLLAGPPVLVVR